MEIEKSTLFKAVDLEKALATLARSKVVVTMTHKTQRKMPSVILESWAGVVSALANDAVWNWRARLVHRASAAATQAELKPTFFPLNSARSRVTA